MQVLLGNSLELLKTIKTDSVDHVITDPPYNMSGRNKIVWKNKSYSSMAESWDNISDYHSFTHSWLTEAFRVVKKSGNLIIFGSYHNMYIIGSYLQSHDKKILNTIIWYKRNAMPNITCRMLCESTEQAIWACNGDTGWVFNYKLMKTLNNGKQMRNMFDIPMTPPSEKKFGHHPNQKPLELINILVRGMTNPNDVVLDPFSGSGTTAVVCKKLGRDFIAMEQKPEYYATMLKRLDDV